MEPCNNRNEMGHMKAKFVKESIQDVLKPPSYEEIAKKMDLDPKDPEFWNKVLIKAVNSGMSKVILLAIDNGANQLWWQSGGPQGGHHGIRYGGGITDHIVKIVGLKGGSSGSYGFYDKTSFSVVYQIVGEKEWRGTSRGMEWKVIKNGNKAGSQLFYRKYSPVDEDFLISIKKVRKDLGNFINFIKKLNKDNESIPQI